MYFKSIFELKQKIFLDDNEQNELINNIDLNKNNLDNINIILNHLIYIKNLINYDIDKVINNIQDINKYKIFWLSSNTKKFINAYLNFLNTNIKKCKDILLENKYNFIQFKSIDIHYKLNINNLTVNKLIELYEKYNDILIVFYITNTYLKYLYEIKETDFIINIINEYIKLYKHYNNKYLLNDISFFDINNEYLLQVYYEEKQIKIPSFNNITNIRLLIIIYYFKSIYNLRNF